MREEIILFLFFILFLWGTESFKIRSVPRRNLGHHLMMTPPDFIDVEVDDGSNDDNKSNEIGRTGAAGANLFPNSDQKESESEPGLLGGIVSKIGSGLSKVFGKDARDTKQKLAARKKQERKNEMDTAIDNIFNEVGAGRGLAGGLLKAAAKGIGGMISDMASDYTSDISEIQEMVIESIEQDSKARFIVGNSVRAGLPFSSSSYSSSINGVTTKRMSYVMPVAGSKGQAQAEVEASESGGAITIQSLVISDGVSRTTIISPGGRGGGPQGGNRRTDKDSGGVIDVEVI